MGNLQNGDRGDSNSGSLDGESGILTVLTECVCVSYMYELCNFTWNFDYN